MDITRVVTRLRSAGCVFAEDEARLLSGGARDDEHLVQMVDARCGGVPLEHIVGWAEFDGLRVTVETGVFVPRPRTELLVHLAATAARPGAVVVDLCCGTGAVGLAIHRRVPGIALYACDIATAAVRCAEQNLRDIPAEVSQGDLFEALPARLRGRVDLIVANAPYVPTGEIGLMPAEAREHEPRIALDGGADGGTVHRRIADDAADWLTPGGLVLVETARSQAAQTERIFAARAFPVSRRHDPGLGATVVTAGPPA